MLWIEEHMEQAEKHANTQAQEKSLTSRSHKPSDVMVDVNVSCFFVQTEWNQVMFDVNVFVELFVGCLTSQQHASVSQGQICSDNFTCCHTKIQVADQTIYLTQSQYTDTGLTSPSTDPIMPSAWQGSHWSASVEATGMTRPEKIPSQVGIEPRIFRSRPGQQGGQVKHKKTAKTENS